MRLDMIGLTCADIGASLAFYKLVGLNTPASWDGPYCELTLEGGVRLSFNDLEMVKKFSPDWQPTVGHRIGLAFLCENVQDVDARFELLAGAGYKKIAAPFDAFWGQRYATIEDPDGNHVDLFHPLPE